MLRTNVTRNVRLFAPRRLLSTTPRVMAGGDTGSGFSRASGERAGDAFTRREAASEELYIKREERAKLMAIREKLAEQKKHIEELDRHIQDLTKDHGGEHN